MQIKKYFLVFSNIISNPKKSKLLPINLQVDVSTFCNLKCIQCYRNENMTKQDINKNLTFEKFKIIFDKVMPDSLNMAASGEPFLNPDFFDMVRYAKSKKKVIVMTSSNQTIRNVSLNEEIVDCGLDILKASIDGASKQTYEIIRGPYFENVIKNLNELNELKIKKRSNIPSLRIDFVVLDKNYEEIIQILHFAKKLNINYVYYRVVDKSGWPKQEIENFYKNVNYEKLINLLKEAKKEAKKLEIKTNINLWFNNLREVELAYKGNSNISKKTKVCVLPWVQLFVSILGDTSSCCTIYPSKEGSYGNIFDKSFQEIWNGEKIQKVRQAFKECKNYDYYEGCMQCIPMNLKNIFLATSLFPNYFKKSVF